MDIIEQESDIITPASEKSKYYSLEDLIKKFSIDPNLILQEAKKGKIFVLFNCDCLQEPYAMGVCVNIVNRINEVDWFIGEKRAYENYLESFYQRYIDSIFPIIGKFYELFHCYNSLLNSSENKIFFAQHFLSLLKELTLKKQEYDRLLKDRKRHYKFKEKQQEILKKVFSWHLYNKQIMGFDKDYNAKFEKMIDELNCNNQIIYFHRFFEHICYFVLSKEMLEKMMKDFNFEITSIKDEISWFSITHVWTNGDKNQEELVAAGWEKLDDEKYIKKISISPYQLLVSEKNKNYLVGLSENSSDNSSTQVEHLKEEEDFGLLLNIGQVLQREYFKNNNLSDYNVIELSNKGYFDTYILANHPKFRRKQCIQRDININVKKPRYFKIKNMTDCNDGHGETGSLQEIIKNGRCIEGENYNSGTIKRIWFFHSENEDYQWCAVLKSALEIEDFLFFEKQIKLFEIDKKTLELDLITKKGKVNLTFPADEIPTEENENCVMLSESNNFYTLEFNGKKSKLIKKREASTCFFYLISNPEKEFSLVFLDQKFWGSSLLNSQSKIAVVEAEDSGLSSSKELNQGIESLSQQDLEKILSDIQDLEKQKKKSKRPEYYQKQIDDLRGYVKSKTNYRGKPRITGSDSQRRNGKIRKGIDRVVESIRENFPELADDVANSITITNESVIYTPKNFKWCMTS